MATKVTYPSLSVNSPHGDIVRHYIQFRRAEFHTELAWFASQPSFKSMLYEAAHARDDLGQRLSHQRRLRRHVIPAAYLLIEKISNELQTAANFEDLFSLIDTELNKVSYAGDLYSYDTALRVGAFLKLFPTQVFLQQGSMVGARKISTTYRERSVPLSQFPKSYHRLAPFEMENLLCCYKNNLHP